MAPRQRRRRLRRSGGGRHLLLRPRRLCRRRLRLRRRRRPGEPRGARDHRWRRQRLRRPDRRVRLGHRRGRPPGGRRPRRPVRLREPGPRVRGRGRLPGGGHRRRRHPDHHPTGGSRARRRAPAHQPPGDRRRPRRRRQVGLRHRGLARLQLHHAHRRLAAYAGPGLERRSLRADHRRPARAPVRRRRRPAGWHADHGWLGRWHRWSARAPGHQCGPRRGGRHRHRPRRRLCGRCHRRR